MIYGGCVVSLIGFRRLSNACQGEKEKERMMTEMRQEDGDDGRGRERE